MSKHGQDYNETRTYKEGFEDGREYERKKEKEEANRFSFGEGLLVLIFVILAVWGGCALVNFIFTTTTNTFDSYIESKVEMEVRQREMERSVTYTGPFYNCDDITKLYPN